MIGKVEERTPYVIVAFQECQRMNFLTSEMKRSLKELELGLKVNFFIHWTRVSSTNSHMILIYRKMLNIYNNN